MCDYHELIKSYIIIIIEPFLRYGALQTKANVRVVEARCSAVICGVLTRQPTRILSAAKALAIS